MKKKIHPDQIFIILLIGMLTQFRRSVSFLLFIKKFVIAEIISVNFGNMILGKHAG